MITCSTLIKASLPRAALRGAVIVLLATISLTQATVHAADDDSADGPSHGNSVWVVDMQQIINSSIIGKAARSNIQDESQKREAKLKVLKVEIDQARQDMQKQGALLSAEAREQRMIQLERRERDFERQISDANEELGRKNQAEIGRVVDEIRVAVRKIAEREGMRFVIEKDDRLVLFVKPDFDLTPRIIKQLDDKKVAG